MAVRGCRVRPFRGARRRIRGVGRGRFRGRGRTLRRGGQRHCLARWCPFGSPGRNGGSRAEGELLTNLFPSTNSGGGSWNHFIRFRMSLGGGCSRHPRQNADPMVGNPRIIELARFVHKIFIREISRRNAHTVSVNATFTDDL
jgi:hypothetical protein